MALPGAEKSLLLLRSGGKTGEKSAAAARVAIIDSRDRHLKDQQI
jgi:hypothetical protein